MKRNWTLYGLIAAFSAAIVFGAVYARSLMSSLDELPSVDGTKASSAGTLPEKTSDVALYYGEQCPHCHTVLDFLAKNDIASKMSFDVKETWNDKGNSRELLERAETCGYSSDEIGVPFLYADGKCYMGAPDVIGYFSEKAGVLADRAGE